VPTDDVMFKCLRRFRLMFHVFHLDVAKVDMECFVCFNDNIQMFQAYVQSVYVVSDVCFKCFYLNVAYVVVAAHACFKYLFSCVLDDLNLCCKSGSGCCICCYGYIHMFKIFYLF
jgi:hypothetical protein